jgi:GrpB-like predicted nucleotidyltransferase (UPF0157 family)
MKSRYDERTEVVVVDYDEAWPERYERERGLVQTALGEVALGIEHIGSTAIPGIAAKLIIDIMVGIRKLSEADDCIGLLDEVGYEFRGDGGMSDHFFWRKGDPREANLHMVEYDNAFWRDHVAYRDALRASPELTREYGDLKTKLAKQFRFDKVAYNEAKGPFIRGVLDRLAND